VALLLDQVLRSGTLALLLVTYPWEPADTDVIASRLGGPMFIVSTLIEYSSLLHRRIPGRPMRQSPGRFA
jgi:hypothetical protein